ncbi:antibiotic biosynthesis monooxygenase family protein [Chelatococcus sp. GCM10030263]|uniref:antibiotic biosynthesis monooxygenase family protein n=1 Tax=Chelatococcus sp. GCM10030263 TaxID=3273387 RepID=UPI003618DC81
MVHEIAVIEIKPGMEQAFEEGAAKAVPLFQKAKGCRSMAVHRSVENPSRYHLVVGWDTVEDHMVGFRESADFQTWRDLVAHCFARPPEVEHTQIAVQGF